MNVRTFYAALRSNARPYQITVVRACRDTVEIQVAESPGRRSAQVHVNGVKVWPK